MDTEERFEGEKVLRPFRQDAANIFTSNDILSCQGTLLVNSVEWWCPLTCRDVPGSDDVRFDEGLFPEIVNRLSRKLNFSVEQIRVVLVRTMIENLDSELIRFGR